MVCPPALASTLQSRTASVRARPDGEASGNHSAFCVVAVGLLASATVWLGRRPRYPTPVCSGIILLAGSPKSAALVALCRQRWNDYACATRRSRCAQHHRLLAARTAG